MFCRTNQTDRTNQTNHTLSDNSGRSDKSDKSDRSDKSDKSDRSDNSDNSDNSDKAFFLSEADSALCGWRFDVFFHVFNVVYPQAPYLFKLLLRPHICRRLVNGDDNVFVVQVLRAEQVHVGVFSDARPGRISTIIFADAHPSLGLFLRFASSIFQFLNCSSSGPFRRGGDVFNAKARCEDCYLNLIAKTLVESDPPFEHEVGPKFGHEIVYIVYFLHHEVGTLIVLCAERNVEQQLLRVEHIVIVEQRRVESIVNGVL